MITLKGDMGLPGSHSYGLTLTAENVPASAAAVLVERAKKNLPDDLVAAGTVRGSVRIEENGAAASKLQFEGRGEIADFRLASAANKAEIGPETIPFLLTAGDSSAGAAAQAADSHEHAGHAISGGSACGVRAVPGGDWTGGGADGSRMDEPRRLQPFGCGRSGHCEVVARGAVVRTRGVAVGDGGQRAG